MKTGVRRIEPLKAGGVRLELENGEEILARRVLSSAGKVETAGLLGAPPSEAGRLGFVETLFCVDDEPKSWGWDDAILFFSHRDNFSYREPSGLVDGTSGIVCCPSNFVGQEHPPEPMVRVTSLANYGQWKAEREKGEAAYVAAKAEFQRAQLDAVAPWFPELSRHVTFRDSFTPLTVERFTSHTNGAVYGAPQKSMTGETGTPGVYLCGTDQGYLGIVGAVLSGVVMANHWVLREA